MQLQYGRLRIDGARRAKGNQSELRWLNWLTELTDWLKRKRQNKMEAATCWSVGADVIVGKGVEPLWLDKCRKSLSKTKKSRHPLSLFDSSGFLPSPLYSTEGEIRCSFAEGCLESFCRRRCFPRRRPPAGIVKDREWLATSYPSAKGSWEDNCVCSAAAYSS